MSEAIEGSNLPNNEKSASDALREKARTSKRVAWLLDECIKIPGTNIKFGLDPIMGLIPGAGDFTATLVGAMVLTEAGKKGIPFGALIKMGGNMLVNALCGALPVVGDLFSVWFKSNKRNYELLTEYLDSEDGDVEGGAGALFIAGFIILTIVLINLAVVVALAFGGWWVWEQLKELNPTGIVPSTSPPESTGY